MNNYNNEQNKLQSQDKQNQTTTQDLNVQTQPKTIDNWKNQSTSKPNNQFSNSQFNSRQQRQEIDQRISYEKKKQKKGNYDDSSHFCIGLALGFLLGLIALCYLLCEPYGSSKKFKKGACTGIIIIYIVYGIYFLIQMSG